jgi:hypothetical protein
VGQGRQDPRIRAPGPIQHHFLPHWYEWSLNSVLVVLQCPRIRAPGPI